ncbi:P-loop containing nucleoside triphosphate hydrolase protein [Xylariaceae sp. FL0016]|nr:P-loop containing nucleoside triphosphate hydrolase protein [Xylariaceae sp. FL0016]
MINTATLHNSFRQDRNTQDIKAILSRNGAYDAREAQTPLPPFDVPFRRDSEFVERKDFLDRIYRECSQPAFRAALVGLGGVGKSQLAIEHTYRARELAKDQNEKLSVYWVHAATRIRVEESFKAIAEIADIPNRDQPATDILQLVYQWLQNEQNGQWLMVLDSADDATIFYDVDPSSNEPADGKESAKALWSYLPQSANGMILITTRDRDLAFRLTGRHQSVIEDGPMDNEHALQLLDKKLGVESEQSEREALIHALGHMPLAISHAAAYIQQRYPFSSVGKYLEIFRKDDQKRLNLLHYETGDLRRDRSASSSVITTWQISFEHIRSQRPSAADLLSLMCFFDSQGIPFSVLRLSDQKADPSESDHDDEERPIRHGEESREVSEDIEEDLVTLQKYCLIAPNQHEDTFEMHPLVQLFTRTWLDANDKAELFRSQFVSRLYTALPTCRWDRKSQQVFHKLLPHIQGAIHHKPGNRESQAEWAALLCNSAQYNVWEGHYNAAQMWAEKATEARKALYGEESIETLDSEYILGMTYNRLGLYERAETVLTKTVELGQRVVGAEHELTLLAMQQLAWTFQYQMRFEDARELAVQIVEIRKELLGVEHQDTLGSIHVLTCILTQQGRFQEAKLVALQLIETQKRLLGVEHPNTKTAMGTLAKIMMNEGQLTEAESLYAEVLGSLTVLKGTVHPQALISARNLAMVLMLQGRLEEAEVLGREVLERQQ